VGDCWGFDAGEDSTRGIPPSKPRSIARSPTQSLYLDVQAVLVLTFATSTSGHFTLLHHWCWSQWFALKRSHGCPRTPL
jgi:hypothetical protein